jgi:hypothetical protein
VFDYNVALPYNTDYFHRKLSILSTPFLQGKKRRKCPYQELEDKMFYANACISPPIVYDRVGQNYIEYLVFPSQ